MGAEVRIRSEQQLLRVPRQRMQRAVRAAFRLAGRRRRKPISVVIVDDRTIRGLHHEFLGQDRAKAGRIHRLSAGLAEKVQIGEEIFGVVIAIAVDVGSGIATGEQVEVRKEIFGIGVAVAIQVGWAAGLGDDPCDPCSP